MTSGPQKLAIENSLVLKNRENLVTRILRGLQYARMLSKLSCSAWSTPCRQLHCASVHAAVPTSLQAYRGHGYGDTDGLPTTVD